MDPVTLSFLLGASAISSLGSSIFNMIGASKKRKQAEAAMEEAKKQVEYGYNQAIDNTKQTSVDKLRYLNLLGSQDYTQRADIQKVYTDLAKQMRDAAKQTANQQFITGASDAAINANKAKMYNAVGDTMQNIAAQASSYKDRIEAEKLRSMDAYTQALNSLYVGRGSSLANIYSQRAGYLTQMAAGKDQNAQRSFDNLSQIAALYELKDK